MEIKFKPEEVNFHREEYQAAVATLRPKDYAPLFKKEVVGKVNLRHRRPNPYLRNGRALVSFVMTGKDLKTDVRKAVDLAGARCAALLPQRPRPAPMGSAVPRRAGAVHKIPGPGSSESQLQQR